MITLSRNLPDRRDLEGSFPGSESGSFASRLANLLTEEIFDSITHCIDLHTGEPHINKFPQVRTATNHADARQLAHYFQPPVIVNTKADEGLLWLLRREDKKVPTIIYETGEALRLDEYGIRLGVKGIVRVMRSLEMLSTKFKSARTRYPVQLDTEHWIRASSSGLCEIFGKVGTFVKRGTRIARISDPFGTEQKEEIFAPFSGIIIGKNSLPILNEGEPILHLAEVKEEAAERIQEWSDAQTSGKDVE
jgi:predicted deacylase